MIKQFLKSRRYRKSSYSQSGEDLIIDFIFKNLMKKYLSSFIDIGCYHPYKLNNTYLFYKNGTRGINIDPNPSSIVLFNKDRGFDKNLQYGVSDEEGILNYYMFSENTLNTFSEEEMKKRERDLQETKLISVKSLKSIIDEFCNGVFPDFLSLDVEGIDLKILSTLQSINSHPKVICVETVYQDDLGVWTKEKEIGKLLNNLGYLQHSETGINSIFIKESELKEGIKIFSNK